MTCCSSTDSLHDYYYDYYNFYPSVGSSYSNDSGMSTPSKQGASGVYKRNRNNMDSALKDDLCGLILGGVEMEEYVQHVYGVSKDDLEYIKSKKWEPEGLAVYTKLLNEGAPEEDLYAPFKAIVADLFDTFAKDEKKLNVHHASLGKTALKSVGNVRKPDQLFFFGSHNNKSPITWSLAKAFVEFAVTPSAQRVKASFGLISTINEDDSVAPGNVVSASMPDLKPSPTTTTPSGRKRRSSDMPSGSSKRARHETLSGKEPQAAGYALELMASACRRWATGVVIRDTQMSLHYYDRVGAIFTKPFSFDKEPWKLALFALAIGQCDVVQAGFDPLIAPDLDTPLTDPLSSLKHAVLHIPKGNGNAQNNGEDGNKEDIDDESNNDKGKIDDWIARGVYSHFEITDDPLYIYGGLTGRGSHVLPGKLIKKAESAIPQESAENVDDEGKRPSLPTNSTGAMVAKLSWPTENRPWLEANTIQDLFEKIPKMKHHLPQIRCAITLKGESIGLPRHLFGDMTTAHKLEQRYFTLLFTDCYNHLWDIKTVADFQLAYIDIVECHHAAMKFGNVLHRDISENNLLWTKSAKNAKRGRTIGVLNDWDLATPVDAIGNSSKHRTGTGPFMALDLLAPEPPVHLYRHDLESLFYVLIWAAVHYNIGDDVPYAHRVDDEVEKWTGTYLEALSAKTLFLSDTGPVLKCIRPAFQGLRPTWIESLCKLFQRAQSNRVLLASQIVEAAQQEIQVELDDTNDVFAPLKEGQVPANMNIDDDDESDHDEEKESELHLPPPPAAPAPPPVDVDYETLGGCLTFESFMAALKWSPRVIRPVDTKDQASKAK
ncbi:hypothetical protein PLEOSDRAFT_1086212 [Pleurotus ostreatus PC15]|uniref:Fungal-type protein kinase domain-containing protein n=1 Tax=Pleurotus ostreatus (strain PC15) TaxID=1137138 RepID=A0A067N9Z8_PLEO1|nr:hypothetical protein PLEOSDRAFT_1086212 [Pleurotus ostreatus PC15]